MFGLFKSKPKAMTKERAEAIINAYGAILMKHPNMVTDENELPFDREEIKEALRFGIAAADDPAMIDMFKAGYVTLGDFLRLTDEERFVVKQQSILQEAGFDPTNATLAEVKKWVAHYAAYRPLMSRVEANAFILAHEVGAPRPEHPKLPEGFGEPG